MISLFRKEAINHATRRLSGEVILAAPPSSRLLALLLVTVVGAALIFSASASYARKETIAGWLTPPEGLIRLPAREGGVVEQIHVVEGQVVSIGQPIATFRVTTALAAGDSYTTASDNLATQEIAARVRAAAARDALAAENTQLRFRRSGLGRELEEARLRLGFQRERVRLAMAEVSRAEVVAEKGFLPGRELEARRSAALGAQQAASDIAAQVLNYERQIAEVDARLAAIPIDLRAAGAEASSTEAGIDQQRSETEARSIYVVVATAPGRVAALPFTRGQSLAPGATVAVMTPPDGMLEAELYAPSRAAGFVRRGQEVRLMYQPFPYQKFGAGSGEVISVSRTVLAPSDVAIEGLTPTEPVFRVRVRLNDQTVSAYGEAIPLQPGMLLNADVIVDRRSLLEWLLDPLYAAGRRG